MRRLVAIGIVCLLLTAGSCDNEATTSTLPDGSIAISKNMRGIWHARGGPSCKWLVRVKSGSRWVTVASGGGAKPQSMLLGTAAVGGELRSSKCGVWKR